MKYNKCSLCISTIHLVLAVITLGHTNIVSAESPTLLLPVESSYYRLKEQTKLETPQHAIDETLVYLEEHPTDGDARLLLGQLYFNNKEYLKARQALIQVLEETPNNLDASLVLANVEIELNNYQEALEIVNSALLLNPTNLDLLKKKSDIVTIIHSNKIPGLLTSTSSAYQTPDVSTSSVQSDIDEYVKLNEFYATKEYSKVIQQAPEYLSKHPTNGDVRLLLSKCYFDSKDYTNARKQLLIILQQTPQNIDAKLILINVEMLSKNYSAALKIADEGLASSPDNKELLLKRKNIISSMNSKKKMKPNNNISTPIPEKIYLNEIGIYQQQYYISDVKKTWDYSTLYYGHQTGIGKIYGKLNYANRFARNALQGEFEAFPRINEHLYLDVDVAFGNDPALFPNQAYGLEAYFTQPKTFDFSLGERFNYVNRTHRFTVFTGMLAKDFNKNRLLFRPYYFVPGKGKPSNLYTLNVRHMIADPYFYIGFIVGAGSSPDLANLTTVNFIVVQNRIISPYINFPLLHERLIVNGSLLYQHQLFPAHRVRNWSGGTVGLTWKF